ncbi:Bicarbonate transporter BicA [Acaryochloris thomasi RCC1774]|uniref:Bicarbonate transporter BicA n=1 Tax=Acaryochloris thomasi RCC1774 TaxID=1764569 RepID=A0A2W1JJ18_9CYAN|nr:SulP family inorganic anion transporter [Acaryochloris thomasi]PZD73428.1 Bicarbonate transporter BicA [Acaryochloris thomasi RCC1774]
MPPSRLKLVNGLHFKNLRGDFFGGITAAIVALPLALAFGVSSGAGAIHGLYGAIFVGFFAALFGGTPSQISGPTGPMTVVMATIVTTLTAKYGVDVGLGMAFTVVMLGGIFQILFGVFQLGKFITLMPYTVISGFMSGIGVIIILLQIGPLLGQAASGNVVTSVVEIPAVLANIEPTSAGLGLLTLAIVFLWPPKLTRVVPAPLLALVICTLLSVFVLPDNPDVRLIGEIPAGLPSFQPPTFNVAVLKEMLGYGIMLATLGAIDSLLTSLVADNVTQTQHNSDRELIGQGIGNFLGGLFGGLPGAGATMRTVINVQAGGRTPLSGMVHALVLLIIVLQASSLTEPIPHSVLAGILIKVGIDIIDWAFLKRAHKLSLKGAGLMYLVLFLTVFVDLITAVAVGAFIANLLTVKSLTDLQVKDMKTIADPTDDGSLTEAEQDLLTQMKGQVLLFSLGGPMSFGAAKAISQRMKIVEKYEVIILDLSEVPRVGVTASLAIENMLKDATRKGHAAFLVGANGQVKSRLKHLDILHDLPEHHWSNNRLEALQQSFKLVQNNLGGMTAMTDSPGG